MKIKTGELTERALDWAVGKIEWAAGGDAGLCEDFCPSTDWAHGGPIIERGRIDIRYIGQTWGAARQLNEYEEPDEWFGPTPLIAAMRCFVASRLGDEVDVPEELVGV